VDLNMKAPFFLTQALAPMLRTAAKHHMAKVINIASIDGLGPRGIGFHTKDEQIELATLILKAQALARFLRSLGPIAGR
jgi:glutamate carboxypeptidase